MFLSGNPQLIIAAITVRIPCNGKHTHSAWNRAQRTVGAQYMWVDVVGTELPRQCGPRCAPRQEKVSEIYTGLNKASFLLQLPLGSSGK